MKHPMRHLLCVALIAQVGIARADDCELDALYPANYSFVDGIPIGYELFNWIGPPHLAPPGMTVGTYAPAPSIGGPHGGPEACQWPVGPNPRPNGNRSFALVHRTLPTDRLWQFNITAFTLIEPVDGNVFPFWSLQLEDAAHTNFVLTATLIPGTTSKVAFALDKVVQGQLVPVGVGYAPFTPSQCTNYTVTMTRSSSGNPTTKFVASVQCPEGVKKVNLSTGNGLLPIDIHYGKLSMDPGPNSTFTFQVLRYPTAAPDGSILTPP